MRKRVIVLKGKSHVMIGTTLGLFLLQELEVQSLQVVGTFFTGIYIGSLLPDADCKSSTMGKIFPLWLITRHRGVTHSFLFLLVPFILTKVFPIPYYFGYGLCCGIASHIFCDLFTPAGCEILFPLKKRFKLPIAKTGSIAEKLFVFIAFGLALLQSYRLLEFYHFI